MNNFFVSAVSHPLHLKRPVRKDEVVTLKMKLLIYGVSSPLATQTQTSDIPADAILELFGKTFFEFCQDSGYDKILQVLGATPRDFLQVSRRESCFEIRMIP